VPFLPAPTPGWTLSERPDFRFEPQRNEDKIIIRNTHPQAGEKAFYETDQRDPARTTFGVIAVTSNLDGTGHVLLIEGINMAGTEAAADYLFSDASREFLSQIRLKRQHASV
jgi:hypothetical protein